MECIGIRKARIECSPDPEHVSTSWAERQNLTWRTHNRRFTRLTSAFSRRAENHARSAALLMTCSNVVRTHRTLRVTPVMAAGVTDRLWEPVMSWRLSGRARPTRDTGAL